ncbi:hypothetical protein GLW04_19325 [Halobacillus litoralis]|uniref:Uncharacterized protein n=1 Tax=Halobacillus litoralis TaxID=45668 RepID=A0A845DYY5_9BACI|nr:hypothetical protein [Halobacillus litoralis]MYL22029.1 hypothetical protein [Halobacillus litoralis]
MTKEDWIDVLSKLSEKGVVDHISLVVSIISPILLFVSVVISFKAANASRDSVSLSKEIYERQEKEQRLLHMPIFEMDNYLISKEKLTFDLLNINDKPASFTNFASHFNDFNVSKKKNQMLGWRINGEFKDGDTIIIWIYYNTLDHRRYCSKLTLRVIGEELVIQDHEIQ